MSTDSKPNSEEPAPALPPWVDCELFCIQDYAGTRASPCGWRGRRNDARRDETGTTLSCPRCGGVTLFRIPLDRSDS